MRIQGLLASAATTAALLVLVGCGSDPPPPPPAKKAPKKVEVVDTGTVVEAPRNTPPKVRLIQIGPDAPTTNSDLVLTVKAIDPDPDDRLDVDRVWFINEQRQADQTGETLSNHLTKKGDIVAVEITVSDGEAEVVQMSRPITIGNAPPSFLTDVRSVSRLDGLKLAVVDPDGDEIQFSLGGAPRGMTIGTSSGIISYKGSADEPGGDYTIRVAANDGDNGRATWEFSVQISPGSGAVRKAEEAKEAAAAKDAGASAP